MTYTVVIPFTVKTKQRGDLTLQAGQVVTLAEDKAAKLVEDGRLAPVFEPVDNLAERMSIVGENTEPEQTTPYITDFDVLVIPCFSHPRYHYWKKGGQGVCDTLRELGRCDLIPVYKSVYSN